MDSGWGWSVILPIAIFLLIDLIVLTFVIVDKTRGARHSCFLTMAVCVCIQQLATLFSFCVELGFIHLNSKVLLYMVTIIGMTAITACAYFFVVYLSLIQEDPDLHLTKNQLIYLNIPVVLIFIVALSSPRTNLLFYYDAEFYYHLGSWGFLQYVCTYFYVIFGIIFLCVAGYKSGFKKVRTSLQVLIAYVAPSVVGSLLQLFVYRGGYTQIGISISLVMLFILRHINEIKRSDDANKAKTVFLTNMSHDIRTPMNAIIGFAELGLKNIDDVDKSKDCYEKILSSSDYLLSLINNVLEMAKIESGETVINEAPCNIEDICNDIDYIYQELMKKKNIEYSHEFVFNTKYVYCDSVRLEQIILIALSNAYKYTDEGGKVVFKVLEIPSDDKNYAKIMFSISDNGIGMTEEFQERMFETFSRERDYTESKIEGSGLGLPIAKKVVELMNGRISVDSKIRKGTTITYTISFKIANEKDIKHEENVEIDPNDFKGKRILLVEDNEMNAEIATEILEEKGVKVELAKDGLEAIKMIEEAKSHYYDAVLMDIQMPNMDGYDATNMIRKMDNKHKANIPIIAMTANAFEEDKKKALEAGMNAHLAKPIDVNKLFKILSTVFEKDE